MDSEQLRREFEAWAADYYAPNDIRWSDAGTNTGGTPYSCCGESTCCLASDWAAWQAAHNAAVEAAAKVCDAVRFDMGLHDLERHGALICGDKIRALKAGE